MRTKSDRWSTARERERGREKVNRGKREGKRSHVKQASSRVVCMDLFQRGSKDGASESASSGGRRIRKVNTRIN
jgi:hypothetical protein